MIDGHDGMGQVLAAKAAEEAVQRAKAHGIAAVGVGNSDHFGTALCFTLPRTQAASASCRRTPAPP
ncbi:Ldh family oxidoreductase [Bradyrhizobium erythrophlei]